MKYAACIIGQWVEIPYVTYEELKENKPGILRRGNTTILLPVITVLAKFKKR